MSWRWSWLAVVIVLMALAWAGGLLGLWVLAIVISVLGLTVGLRPKA